AERVGGPYDVTAAEPPAALPARLQRSQAAVASAAGAFAVGPSTRGATAGGSVTARSARIFRSTSIPAALRPEMKRLYVIPSARAAALIRCIHSLRKSPLRARRSR